MKATGIVRKVDELGRVVIPIELRRTLNFTTGTPLEMFVDGDDIIMRAYSRGCLFCGKIDTDLVPYHGKLVCRSCATSINLGFAASKLPTEEAK